MDKLGNLTAEEQQAYNPVVQTVLMTTTARQHDEEYDRMAAVVQLEALCDHYGYARVARWLKNLAAINGEQI